MGGFRKPRGAADSLITGTVARPAPALRLELTDDEWERLSAAAMSGGVRNDVEQFISHARLHRVQHLRLRTEVEALLEVLRGNPAVRSDPATIAQARRIIRLLQDGIAG